MNQLSQQDRSAMGSSPVWQAINGNGETREILRQVARIQTSLHYKTLRQGMQ